MNLKELKEKLIQEKIPQYIWGVPDQFAPFSNFWLEQNKEWNWVVYYQDERGNKKIIKTFLDEKEACEFFYNYVIEKYNWGKERTKKDK